MEIGQRLATLVLQYCSFPLPVAVVVAVAAVAAAVAAVAAVAAAVAAVAAVATVAAVAAVAAVAVLVVFAAVHLFSSTTIEYHQALQNCHSVSTNNTTQRVGICTPLKN